MKSQLLLIIFLASLLLTQNATAQQDYIIKVEKDTIYGNVSNNLFGKPRFTAADESESQPVSANDVKEYFDLKANECYVAKVLPGKSRNEFLQRLENGKIQLFEFFKSTYSPQPGGGAIYNNQRRWFVCKGNGPLVEVKRNQLGGSRKKRKDAFYLLIADNKAVSEKFESEDKFSFNRLRELIREYNQ